jgi:hypothetical protein
MVLKAIIQTFFQRMNKENAMKSLFLLSHTCLLSLILLLTGFLTPSLSASDLTATEIMRRVIKRDDGKTSISEMTMILIDKRNSQRVRKMKAFRKDYEDVTKSISFFLSPADVRNTAFLSYDWEDDEKEDDNWLYLPALRKVKRISAGNRKESFMGSDFTYADMNGLEIDDWDFRFLKDSEVVNGQDCWVIEAEPKAAKKNTVIDEIGYVMAVSWVRKDIFMTIQAKSYVQRDKKIKYFTASDIENIQGIWTAKKLTMATTKGNRLEHQTVLVFDNIQYNTGVDDTLFTTHRMERGL